MGNEKKLHTQTSLADGAVSHEEQLRQKKAEMQKKYRRMSWILIGIMIVTVAVYVCCYQKCIMFGHQWKAASCELPKTCSVCNKCEGEALGHDWRAVNCETPKTCAACGETTGEALGHDWREANCEEPETCTVCGETNGVALGHDWLDASCTKPRVCANCGETEGEALGHSWTAATCTTPRECARCGEIKGDPLGHDWKDATCEQPAVCYVCAVTSGKPLGHDWIPATDHTPKTCDTCGKTEGEPLLRENAYAKYEVGDTFYFGSYEQNGSLTDGAESIQWIVLAKESDRILVISVKALECMQFHAKDTAVTWEKCDLRKYLNGSFYDDAFTKAEKAVILASEVSAEKNPWYSIDPGADTVDYIFIPSLSEMTQYFDGSEDRKCVATTYAIRKGAYAPASQGYCTWWLLRNPGEARDKVANVNTDGKLDYVGSRVESVNGAVRVMMWIKTAERT